MSTGLTLVRATGFYFGKDGDQPEILVGGETKKRQQEDINTALARWQDYKQRKGTGR